MAMWIATAVLAAALAAPLAAPLPPPDPAQLFVVPPELHTRLQQRLATRGTSDQERMYAIVDFIFDRDGMALTYDDTQTRTIAQMSSDGKANCLSFTLLFLALSRDAGLRPQAQEIAQALTWREDGNAFYVSGHVNAGLRIAGRKWTADLARSIEPSPQAPTPISDARLVAHFHNNRGAELMAAGEFAAADTHLHASIALDPTLAEPWNNLGVLQVRRGDAQSAVTSYRAALDVDKDNSAALSNLVSLYRRSDDPRAADVYLQRLKRVEAHDPFRQYVLGTDAERAGRLEDAVRYYRRAVALYDGAHQFHFGLARTYFLMGKSKPAERELARAMALGRRDSTVERRYAAKLASLRSLAGGHAAAPAGTSDRALR